MSDIKRIVAIMGPSGSGKTTLGTNLSVRNGLIIPRHVTTREPRSDDMIGFYRYIDHDIYRGLYVAKKFLISSGDNEIIAKGNGNFYGVLIDDCNAAWQLNNDIILFTSYKDIMTLIQLKDEHDVKILNITFRDIENGVRTRLTMDSKRGHSQASIESRVYWALKDEQDYGHKVDSYADISICTDSMGIEQTYNEACKVLKLTAK